MKQFNFLRILSLGLLAVSLIAIDSSAQKRPATPKPPEPKNEIGLTEKQTKDAKALAEVCIALAKEMASGKKKYSDLTDDQKKQYNECEKIWGTFFTNLLEKYRAEQAKQAMSTQSNEVVETLALLLIASPDQSERVLASAYERGIEMEVLAASEAMTDILIELLDEAHENGYAVEATPVSAALSL